MFYPQGLDWRWRSYGEVAAAVAARRAGGEKRTAADDGRTERTADGARESGGGPTADDVIAWLAKAPIVHPGGRRLAQVAWASGIRGRSRPRPEVTILARPLSDPHAALLITWSLLTGAALVLEPDRRALVATTVWVRPTLFVGDDDELRRLAAEIGDRAPSPLAGLGALLRRLLAPLGVHSASALPLGRLHTALRIGDTRGREVERFWSERGARVLDGTAFFS